MATPAPHIPPQQRDNENDRTHDADCVRVSVMLTNTVHVFNTPTLPCLDVRPQTGTCYAREAHRPLTDAERRKLKLKRGARRSTGLINHENLCPACRLYVSASLALADWSRWVR